MNWKLNQSIYNQLMVEHSDDESRHKRTFNGDVVYGALNFLTKKDNIGIYPGKSYAVALVYADFLTSRYSGSLKDYLNDPELLFNQDKHYKTYAEDPGTYDELFEYIEQTKDWKTLGWVPYTRHYAFLELTDEGLALVQQAIVEERLDLLDPDISLIAT